VHPQATRVHKDFSRSRAAATRGLRYRWFKVGATSACRLEMATVNTAAVNWVQTGTTTESAPITWTTHSSGAFIYRQRTIDVSGLKPLLGSGWNTSISVPNLNLVGGTNTDVKLSGNDYISRITRGGTSAAKTVDWLGCVEERGSDPSITGTTPLTSIPTNAKDLNVTIAASTTDDSTRWRPWLPTAFYTPDGDDYKASSSDRNRDESCAGPSLKLQEIANYSSTILDAGSHNYPTLFDGAAGGATSYFYPYDATVGSTKNLATLENYIDRIPLSHGTVHDAGLIWGMHLLSGQGMFSGENPDFFDGNIVSRNLVFMTDGEANPGEERYVYSGHNQVDGRIAPRTNSDSQMKVVQNRRMRILCEAAKRQGINVWVVVIKDGVSNDDDLRKCASSSGHFKTAATGDELVASFTAIAQSIGGLRLTQ
jgi:hypothetical protein